MASGLLKKAEAAEMLKVSMATLDRWIRKGYVVAYKVGRSVRVDRASILSKLDESKVKTKGEGDE